jgi:hypothetical protein
MEEQETLDVESSKEEENKLECPICKSNNVVVSGHCFTCYECGYSLCSL